MSRLYETQCLARRGLLPVLKTRQGLNKIKPENTLFYLSPVSNPEPQGKVVEETEQTELQYKMSRNIEAVMNRRKIKNYPKKIKRLFQKQSVRSSACHLQVKSAWQTVMTSLSMRKIRYGTVQVFHREKKSFCATSLSMSCVLRKTSVVRILLQNIFEKFWTLRMRTRSWTYLIWIQAWK